jgi:ribosome-associated toxin RatA of RatAB toxin-antitoxin module|tara:strand:+ start:10516 stop:10899 length:384 start_codon:yes stop_codon:yes gene_type:complete
MFDLVAEVDKYPQFMPWCGGASVQSRDEHGMQATITISFAGIRQSFTTRNEHDYPRQITFNLVDGPFSELTGKWEFVELSPDACKVVYTMQYAFANRGLERVVGPVFNRIASSFIDSFTQRAQACYD